MFWCNIIEYSINVVDGQWWTFVEHGPNDKCVESKVLVLMWTKMDWSPYTILYILLAYVPNFYKFFIWFRLQCSSGLRSQWDLSDYGILRSHIYLYLTLSYVVIMTEEILGSNVFKHIYGWIHFGWIPALRLMCKTHVFENGSYFSMVALILIISPHKSRWRY